MTMQQVEWVLVVHYGKSAHRAAYGRLPGQTYTKDYIQLSRKADFISSLEAAFPEIADGKESIAIEFHWPSGSATGKLFRRSADRPHLAWETNSAPPPWKMSLHPTELTVETILGNPEHTTATAADNEFAKMVSSGFGQPFLLAVKLRNETQKLHLRVHIDTPNEGFEWASLDLAPQPIQDLAASTSQNSALAWRLFSADGEGSVLHFDPSKKTNPWNDEPDGGTGQEVVLPAHLVSSVPPLSSVADSDASAEVAPLSKDEVSLFEESLKIGSYEVADSSATVKTRGSAQRVFADAVKRNYGHRCALTGITSREFLIASHIVPWSADETIRLDPSNGICLSVLVDRAFEVGCLVVDDDLTVNVNWGKVGEDNKLKDALKEFDGSKLATPISHPPKVEYLQRRRKLY